RLSVEHVALATRVNIAILFDVHRAAPEVMTGMLPLIRGMSCVRTHQVGFVFLDTDLVDAGHGLPEIDEIRDFAGVALHADHLRYHLQFGVPLVLHSREPYEIVAYLLELGALAVELVALPAGAVKTQR